MTNRTDDRLVMVLTAIYALLLLGCSWSLLGDWEVPAWFSVSLRVLVILGAASAMQGWLPVLRMVGFAVLWWWPCVYLGNSTGWSGLILLLCRHCNWDEWCALAMSLATIEAIAIAVWVQPWVGRLFLGRAPSKGAPPSSHAA